MAEALRMLTVLDEHTKEVHVLRSERRIGSADVIALVKSAIAEHGAPQLIRSDNGPEFIAKDLQRWPAEPLTKARVVVEDFGQWDWSRQFPARQWCWRGCKHRASMANTGRYGCARARRLGRQAGVLLRMRVIPRRQRFHQQG